MFFVLSKTISFLAMPMTIVMALLIAGTFLRNAKWKKRCLIAAVVAFFLFSNSFLANQIMGAWETDTPAFASMRHYKLGIVLTGATIPDLEPDDRVYFHRGADRVIHTVQLYKLGLLDTILISGGSGRVIDEVGPEAEKLREVMVLMGVPREDIWVENESRNTHESAVNVASMLNEVQIGPTDCLLITSAFHMRRSRACFRKVGLDLDTFSTDFYARPATYYPDQFIIPRAEAMILWEKLFKEWIGMVAYKFAGYI